MKFWNWTPKTDNDDERELVLDGAISDESWWGDEVTPALFRAELEKGNGPITVWINSPGGDVFAGSSIYTMLRDYPGRVTVKIDALAASAASVIAMAGDEVLMAPTAQLMIHDPSTLAYGTAEDMKAAIGVLKEVKESIINAYEIKTGLDRETLARMMSNETWMNSRKAIELGFADGEITANNRKAATGAQMYAGRTAEAELVRQAVAKAKAEMPQNESPREGRAIQECFDELAKIKH